MEQVYMASLAGEIVLKSKRTRPRFEERLLANLRDALRRKKVEYKRVWISDARLFIDSGDDRVPYVATRVFGIYSITRAYIVRFNGLEDLAGRVEEIAKEWVSGRKFAVRARRTGRHDFTSLDAARVIGERLYGYSAGVDLENPEVEVFVEIRGNIAYVYREKLRGPGGLPIGVEGRALLLFSGGFDSPVAGWFTAKRGVEVDMLHFVLSVEESARDAEAVARKLAEEWLYGYRPILYVVDFRPVVGAIARKTRPDYSQLVLRVLMYRYAEELALERGYDALVTGESLGQVSSQTLKNIKALTRVAGLSLPVLRPLLGLDKEEIVDFSRRIGLYELSSRVKEYCRLSESPTTRADAELLGREVEEVEDVLKAVRKPEKIVLV